MQCLRAGTAVWTGRYLMTRFWPGSGLETAAFWYRETVFHIAVTQLRADDGGKRGETRVKVDGIEH